MAAEQIFAKLSQLETFGKKVFERLSGLGTRLDTLERSGGQPNVIEKIRVNGDQLAVDGNKTVDVIVPTTTGQLTNNTDFQNGKQVKAAVEDGLTQFDKGLDERIREQVGAHDHDDRYYTEAEVDTKLAGKANSSHSHNSLYYTKTETDTKLSGLPTSGHTHDDRYYTKTETDTKLAGKANSSHTHNYAGSSSAGGAATSANKLNTNAGSSTQPVFFKNGVPVATTYTLGKSVPADADFTNTTYSAMTAATADAAGKAGLVPAPAKGAQAKYLRGDGTWQTPPDTNTTYSNMSGASSSAAGKAGLVPAPAAGAQAKYLRGDGTWQTPPDTNTTYSAMTGATSSAAGKAGLVPAPAAGKQAQFLRGDGTWATPVEITAQTTDPGAGSTLTTGKLLLVYV